MLMERPTGAGSRRHSKSMQLKPIDSPELLHLVASWLGQKENYQWLDFGDGRQMLTPEWLKIMTQRDTHFIRVWTSDDATPIGVAGLDAVNRSFKTGRFLVLPRGKAFPARGEFNRPASGGPTIAFSC